MLSKVDRKSWRGPGNIDKALKPTRGILAEANSTTAERKGNKKEYINRIRHYLQIKNLSLPLKKLFILNIIRFFFRNQF